MFAAVNIILLQVWEKDKERWGCGEAHARSIYIESDVLFSHS